MLVSCQSLIVFFLLAGGIGERYNSVLVAESWKLKYQLEPVEEMVDTRFARIFIHNSDSVWVDGILLSRTAYTVEPNRREINFFQPLPEFAVIRVVYSTLVMSPLQFNGRTAEAESVQLSKRDTIQVIARFDSTQDVSRDDWQISGAKSVGFSLNNEAGLGINQTTRLSLKGQVENLEIEGELSDQRLPIPATGTTLELEEIDKISITVKGRSWSGQFGDVGLTVDAGGFGTFPREASGGILKTENKVIQGSFTYARSRGEFGKVILKGIEGIQGPYTLTVDGQSIQIVPGSENVYLNGRKMTRGWDADYIIDYSTGELVFTNRNIITARSRIEVEFQFYAFDYERTLVASGMKNTEGPLQLQLMLFQERDDPNRTLNYTLTEEAKQKLAFCGRDTGRCWISGAKYVGDGQGDYVLEDGHYRFVGAKSGDYLVKFTFVGDSQGSYNYNYYSGGFEFVGYKAGDYIDSINVQLPRMRQIIYSKAGYCYQGLGVFVEGAFLRRNVNLFAGENGVINAGAWNYGFTWTKNFISFQYQHKVRGESFSLSTKSGDIEFPYHWGGVSETGYIGIDELKIQALPDNNTGLNVEVGRLKQTGGQYIERWGADGRIRWLTLGAHRAGNFSRMNAGITPRILIFSPLFTLGLEEDSAERSQSWQTGLMVEPWQNTTLSADLQVCGYAAKDSSATNAWKETGRSQLLQLKYQQNFKDFFRFDGICGYQYYNTINFSDNTGGRKFFGGINGGLAPTKGIRLNFDVSQINRQLQLKDEIFRYVGPHKGTYRRDTLTGSYISDPHGDYERVLVYQGKFTDVSDFSMSINTSVTDIQVLEFTGSYTRNLTSSDTSQLTVNNFYDFRLQWKGIEPLVRILTGVQGNIASDRTLLISGRQFSQNSQFIELSVDPSAELELFVRGERKKIIRWLYSGELEYDGESRRLELAPILESKLRAELGVFGELGWISEPLFYRELGKFRLNAAGLWLTQSFTFGQRIKFQPRVELTYRWANVAYLPFDIELTSPLGFTPKVQLKVDHLWSDVVSLSGEYIFCDQPNRIPQHTVSLILRANF